MRVPVDGWLDGDSSMVLKKKKMMQKKKVHNSQAPLRIRKLLMIPHQMLFIPRIVLDLLVILNTVERHLAEAVVVGDVPPTQPHKSPPRSQHAYIHEKRKKTRRGKRKEEEKEKSN
jgi:hypothetical protein